MVWRRVGGSLEAGGSNSFVRKEGAMVWKNREKGSLEGVERFGELHLCDRRVVRLKALRQAGSRNPTVKLGPSMFVHMCPLYNKVKHRIF